MGYGKGEASRGRAWTAGMILPPYTSPGAVLEALFYSFVEKQSGENGCWLWTGDKTSSGYGRVNIGKMMLAHRLAVLMAGVSIPEGYSVCHHCDVRLCVRQSHLFVGTRSDNMRDAVRKGRLRIPVRRGEQVNLAKLTEAKVIEIRSLSLSRRELATRYGVCLATIDKIRSRRLWRHVA